jgi:hypothetical protein
MKIFMKASNFEFQRFLNIIAIIASGALIIADNVYGSLLGVMSIVYYAVLHMSPLVEDQASSQQQRWDTFVKYFAVIGGLLILMTRDTKLYQRQLSSSGEKSKVRFNMRKVE